MDDDDWGGVGWLNCPQCLTALEVDGDARAPTSSAPSAGWSASPHSVSHDSNVSSNLVGQNRRYGSDNSRATMAEFTLRPRPISLTAEQIGEPIRTAKRPIPVVAWVPFRDAQVELDGHALAWTDKAVQVQVMMRADAKHTVWVWASAVGRGR